MGAGGERPRGGWARQGLQEALQEALQAPLGRDASCLSRAAVSGFLGYPGWQAVGQARAREWRGGLCRRAWRDPLRYPALLGMSPRPQHGEARPGGGSLPRTFWHVELGVCAQLRVMVLGRSRWPWLGSCVPLCDSVLLLLCILICITVLFFLYL